MHSQSSHYDAQWFLHCGHCGQSPVCYCHAVSSVCFQEARHCDIAVPGMQPSLHPHCIFLQCQSSAAKMATTRWQHRWKPVVAAAFGAFAGRVNLWFWGDSANSADSGGAGSDREEYRRAEPLRAVWTKNRERREGDRSSQTASEWRRGLNITSNTNEPESRPE